MNSRFLFSEWRFVGRLMRKKGLLLAVVLLLQAGLLVSLGIVLSSTRVKDSVSGEATVQLKGKTLHASFTARNAVATAMLEGVGQAVLTLAVPEQPDGLSLPVRVEIGPDNALLCSSVPDASSGVFSAGGSRTALSSGTFAAKLDFRRRTLLSAILDDRKQTGKHGGAGFFPGF